MNVERRGIGQRGKHNDAILVGLLLCTAVWIVYLGALHLEFVRYDDQEYVFENPFVRTGLTWKGLACLEPTCLEPICAGQI